MRSRLAALVGVLLIVLAACSSNGSSSASSTVASAAVPSTAPSIGPSVAPASPSVTAVDLTIYGAASLKGALADAKTAYEAANPGVTLTVSTDASSALAAQIEQAAPADVFLSADTKNPQALVDKGLAHGPIAPFADNHLIVIVPMANPAGITTPVDLAKKGVKVVAAGDEVPITKYANQVVANLAKQPGYPADFAASYAANIVSKEDNVKAVVGKVELGEGDAGIVYVTDANASGQVRTVPVPDDANVPATYAGAVVTASKHQDAANAFLTWFAGPAGQEILKTYGFLPASR